MNSKATIGPMSVFNAPASSAPAEARVRELVAFALRELPRMSYRDGLYCLEVHDADTRPRGRSFRYSVMVALGLLRARAAGYDVATDLDSLVDLLLMRFDAHSLTPGDLGLLLWLNQRAGRDRAGVLLPAVQRSLQLHGGLSEREGMEVAWITIGAAHCMERAASDQAENLLVRARTELSTRITTSGLLRHRSAGWRGRFPNFATQIYGALALTTLGRQGDAEALTLARRLADVLVGLQQPDGGWPWLFDAVSGRVVEAYEVYTVHQDAMAPMGLFELYEATGEDRYRAAAARGLDWIYGDNDLARPMLDEHRRLLYRSIRRKPPWDRAILGVNTALSYAGRPLGAQWRSALELNRTDRPYHLGWVLEAWCGREGLISPSPQN